MVADDRVGVRGGETRRLREMRLLADAIVLPLGFGKLLSGLKFPLFSPAPDSFLSFGLYVPPYLRCIHL